LYNDFMKKDLAVRLAAFGWLSKQTNIHGDVLPRALLQRGFEYDGNRIPLIAPQGIFKPQVLDLPISITTSPNSPYDDSFNQDGLLVYRYRGTDPNHRDNIGLREIFKQQKPLVYLHGVVPGKYLAVWPVYIVSDHPESLSVQAAVDDISSVAYEAVHENVVAESSSAKRAYLTATVRQRLHQRSFREKVLAAYRDQCAFCRLKHRELLDASHIIPDSVEESRPRVDNGLALCKLHHAAFDSFILGVSPDFVVQVREDILEEVDGPLLKHGLQELHGSKIMLPSRKVDWPNRDALAWRYEQYLGSS
jgi:putative restriction endonuclease